MQEKISRLVQTAQKEGIGRFVVAGIINRNDKVLCLKRAASDFMPGLYELPSGKVDKGETLDIALIREVKEETNLNVISIKKYIDSFDYLSGSGIQTRQFTFLVDVNPMDRVMLDEKEHEGYTWLMLSELNNYRISTEVKKLISTHLEEKINLAKSDFNPTLFRKREREDEEQGEDLNPTKIKAPTLSQNEEDK